ncbi:ribosomal L7Ae/L30e/S12e/Gadd45 family protein [candidate division KSB1 bacterium]|nr:ribosomal L7Ae/L30e/S12e/Gadd45 family protein [candidate division KSB1 bacterium]
MDDHKILTLVGFANKAGKTALGRTAVLHKKNIRLLVIATDASPKLENELKKILHPVPPVIRVADKNQLGRICGRDQLTVVGICDTEFAGAMKKLKHPAP